MAKAQNRKRKLKSRAGRPRKEGVRRTKSGRISESKAQKEQTAQETIETAIEARIRIAAIDGEQITRKEARDPRRGYVAGRKCLNGDLGSGPERDIRLQVGNDTAATIRRCMAILGYPPPTSQAMNMGRVRGLPIEDLNASQQARVASQTIMQIEAKLGSAGAHCRTCFRQVFIQEEESAMWT